MPAWAVSRIRLLWLSTYWWRHPVLWQRWQVDRIRKWVHRRLPWNYCDHYMDQMVGPYVTCRRCYRIWGFRPHGGNS
jgi:hypothetical protein